MVCSAPESTRLAALLVGSLQTVHVQASEVLAPIFEACQQGETPSDTVLCDAMLARLQEDDCKTSGVVLEGFPLSALQADLLAAGGFSLDFLFSLQLPGDPGSYLEALEGLLGRGEAPLAIGTVLHHPTTGVLATL